VTARSSSESARDIPEATVARLPVYLRALTTLADAGTGNLGHALANYSGFRSRGFRVVALLDADPTRTDELVAGVAVRPFAELEQIVRDQDVAIGVIATPAVAAQDVADRMVGCGITSILNFAPTVINVREGVDVRKVDLSIELQILAYHEQRKAQADPAPGLERGTA
jgi:redox-sensing transcriptional repressor